MHVLSYCMEQVIIFCSLIKCIISQDYLTNFTIINLRGKTFNEKVVQCFRKHQIQEPQITYLLCNNLSIS